MGPRALDVALPAGNEVGADAVLAPVGFEVAVDAVGPAHHFLALGVFQVDEVTLRAGDAGGADAALAVISALTSDILLPIDLQFAVPELLDNGMRFWANRKALSERDVIRLRAVPAASGALAAVQAIRPAMLVADALTALSELWLALPAVAVEAAQTVFPACFGGSGVLW